jgi:hypothetical protein
MVAVPELELLQVIVEEEPGVVVDTISESELDQVDDAGTSPI